MVPRSFKAATIQETMLYKDFLVRNGNPLNEEQERKRENRLKGKHKNAKKKQALQPVTSNSGDEVLLWILTKGTLEDYYAPKHHNPTSSNTQKGLFKLLRAL
jgi:hypothetical protein